MLVVSEALRVRKRGLELRPGGVGGNVLAYEGVEVKNCTLSPLKAEAVSQLLRIDLQPDWPPFLQS